jgi:tetratricopeptide (TPR) repeat protein
MNRQDLGLAESFTSSAHPCEDFNRRDLLLTAASVVVSSAIFAPKAAFADDDVLTVSLAPVEVTPSVPDAKKLFNEARALESQGNMAAAQRLYAKVTKISPRFIYGWSNLGNTQVAMGDLGGAEENYSQAIDLCRETLSDSNGSGRKCNDLYLLMLNRGSVRLNTPGMAKEALKDLQQADMLRQRPDAIVLQNLARAKELNGMYSSADRDYTVSISMTANEVNPFWLRAAMVKLQLGDAKGGMDLLKRVENRFPDAPEVKAASATFLAEQGKQIEAQRKFLEIPDRQRLKYVDDEYLQTVIAWPPAMRDGVTNIARAVGDKK